MKYIRYTYIDRKTKEPVSQSPAKNGPLHPEGISPTFAIEDSFQSGIPTFYGIAEDTFEPEDWMYETTEESFYQIMKEEFKDRARKKRKQVEQGGITLADGNLVDTSIDSQNRISGLVASINNDPDLVSIDFEATPGTWTTLTRDQGLSIGVAVSNHIQKCFTWCRGIHEQVDAATVLDDYLPIIQEIQAFGQEESVQ